MVALFLRKIGATFVFMTGIAVPVLFSANPLTPDPPPVSPSQKLLLRKSDHSWEDEGSWPVLANLVNLHSDEILVLDTDSPSPERWSEMLQDRVFRAKTTMAPPLLVMLRQLSMRHPKSRIEIVSGFRSPKLNEVLRKKGHRVASHSQHSLGHALDFRLVGLTPKQLRDEVRSLGWEGGVGQYDKLTDRFVHIDVGPNRNWRER